MVTFLKKHYPKLVIALLFAIVYIFCFDVKPDMNGDNAQYVKLAHNISKGLGYSNISTSGITPASHYPPGYSFLLSIFISLGVNSITFFKALNGFLCLVSLFLVFYTTRGITKNRELAFAIATLTIFSPRLINFSFMAMSEMLYMLMTIIALYALYKYDDKEKPFYKVPYFYIAIVAVSASYYIRTIGISAIVAMVGYFLCRKNWKASLASALGTIMLLLPWSIRNSVLGIESRYLGTVMTVNPWRPEEGTISSVGEMVEKMIKNFDDTVIKGFKILLFPFTTVDFNAPSSLGAIALGAIILAIMVYGIWNFGKLRYFLLLFFVANVGLFMLWHGGNQERYVIPLIPFIFTVFWVGAYKLATLKVKFSPLFLLIFVLPMLKPIDSLSKISQRDYAPGFRNYCQVLKSIDGNFPEKSVICCRKPEFLAFYAKNAIGTNYLYSLNDKEVIADMVKKGVDYVILDQIGFSSTPRYLYPAIQKNNELFVVMAQMQNPNTYILKFNRELAIEKLALN